MKTNKFIFTLLPLISIAWFSVSCVEKEDPTIPVEDIMLDKNDISIVVGESYQLTATINPENVTDPTITWKSNDGTIAAVDNNGKVSGKALGETFVTARAGDYTATCRIEVIPTPVKSITITPAEADVEIGHRLALEVRIEPAEAAGQKIIWSTSDRDIAPVDQKGNVTALSIGKAVITAKVGDMKGTCSISVTGTPVESITLDQTELELVPGESVQLNAEILPVHARNKTLNWTSSNETSVTVSQEGLVKAEAIGQATIIAEADGVKAMCDVVVREPGKAQIGDFYYSDGTWSSQLNRDKTPIGIVFWLGDPSVHDKALQREHPECKNGLVIALKQSDVRWQIGQSFPAFAWVEVNLQDYASPKAVKAITSPLEPDNLNWILGYNNTKAFEKYNEYNPEIKVMAVQAVVDFRKECPAPEHTSDWYLPSPKELSLLSGGEYDENIYDKVFGNEIAKKLNEQLIKINTDAKLPMGLYYSSTEYDLTEIFFVDLSCGTCNKIAKHLGGYARAVLAF